MKHLFDFCMQAIGRLMAAAYARPSLCASLIKDAQHHFKTRALQRLQRLLKGARLAGSCKMRCPYGARFVLCFTAVATSVPASATCRAAYRLACPSAHGHFTLHEVAYRRAVPLVEGIMCTCGDGKSAVGMLCSLQRLLFAVCVQSKRPGNWHCHVSV